jgi:hypothetical protein
VLLLLLLQLLPAAANIFGEALLRIVGAGPVVSNAGSGNWVASGITSVTVTGLAFWSTDYTASTLLTDAACKTTSWSSTTSMACTAPAGFQGYTRSTVSTVVSTALRLFSYDGKPQLICDI